MRWLILILTITVAACDMSQSATTSNSDTNIAFNPLLGAQFLNTIPDPGDEFLGTRE